MTASCNYAEMMMRLRERCGARNASAAARSGSRRCATARQKVPLAGLHDDMRSACLSAGFFRSMVTRKTFETRVRELCAGQAMREQICQAMLAARAALQIE